MDSCRSFHPFSSALDCLSKYINPQTQADGRVRSVTITRWTPESTRRLPQQSAQVIRNFMQQFLPEVVACPVKTRLCWYADSFDNGFVVDFVPGVEGLMVATGGSGHGFKFLPNLGRFAVDRVEAKADEDGFLAKWAWEEPREGEARVQQYRGGHAECTLIAESAADG